MEITSSVDHSTADYQNNYVILNHMLSPTPRICASCSEQTDANLSCTRCHALYCSSECQKTASASGGHNKACKGLARVRRDTNRDAQSRALAYVVHMSGGVPDDVRCLLCLDGGVTPQTRSCGGARAGDRPGGRTRRVWSSRRRPRERHRRRRRASPPGSFARRVSSGSRAWSSCSSRSRYGRITRARRR